MSTVQVFDPPMCCATGVCGPTVDPNVVQFAADLDWLATRGVTVRRFNLAQEPTNFAENAAVKALLARSNGAELPAIVVNGAVVASGRYPTRDELAAFAGLAAGVATGHPRGSQNREARQFRRQYWRGKSRGRDAKERSDGEHGSESNRDIHLRNLRSGARKDAHARHASPRGRGAA